MGASDDALDVAVRRASGDAVAAAVDGLAAAVAPAAPRLLPSRTRPSDAVGRRRRLAARRRAEEVSSVDRVPRATRDGALAPPCSHEFHAHLRAAILRIRPRSRRGACPTCPVFAESLLPGAAIFVFWGCCDTAGTPIATNFFTHIMAPHSRVVNMRPGR